MFVKLVDSVVPQAQPVCECQDAGLQLWNFNMRLPMWIPNKLLCGVFLLSFAFCFKINQNYTKQMSDVLKDTQNGAKQHMMEAWRF